MPGIINDTQWRYYIIVCLDPAAMKAAMPTDEEGTILWPWRGNRTPLLRPGHYEDADYGDGEIIRIYVIDPGNERAAIVAVPEVNVDARAVIEAHCTIRRATKENAQALQALYPQFRFKELGSFVGQIIPDTAPDYDGN